MSQPCSSPGGASPVDMSVLSGARSSAIAAFSGRRPRHAERTARPDSHTAARGRHWGARVPGPRRPKSPRRPDQLVANRQRKANRGDRVRAKGLARSKLRGNLRGHATIAAQHGAGILRAPLRGDRPRHSVQGQSGGGRRRHVMAGPGNGHGIVVTQSGQLQRRDEGGHDDRRIDHQYRSAVLVEIDQVCGRVDHVERNAVSPVLIPCEIGGAFGREDQSR